MRVTFSPQTRLRRAPRSPFCLDTVFVRGYPSARSVLIRLSRRSKDGVVSVLLCAANQAASLRKEAACSGYYCFSHPLARLEQSALVSTELNGFTVVSTGTAMAGSEED